MNARAYTPWEHHARIAQIHRLEGHTQYVQGVAWDPAGVYIATESNDRSLRVFKSHGPKAGRPHASITWGCAHVVNRREQTGAAPAAAVLTPAAIQADAVTTGSSTSAGEAAPATLVVKHHLFADESVVSFFRRPAWTPDGSLLIVPTGLYKVPGGAAAATSAGLDAAAASVKGVPTTYVFARDRFAAPVAHFPGTSHSKASICTRASPVLYVLGAAEPSATHASSSGGRSVSPSLEGAAAAEHVNDAGAVVANNGAFALPYRMYIAVATLDSVLVYDTQQRLPVAVLAGFHVDKITDMAWCVTACVVLCSARFCAASLHAHARARAHVQVCQRRAVVRGLH